MKMFSSSRLDTLSHRIEWMGEYSIRRETEKEWSAGEEEEPATECTEGAELEGEGGENRHHL